MKLGLRGDEVKLVAYTDEWREEFDRTKQAIWQATSINELRIEHIGSTAIQGIAA